MVDGDGLLRPASPRAPLLRLATWNVNSIRIRLDRVLDWMRRADIDILAMQETKCADDQFPALPFFELGYEVAHCGFNQWNGVAIASRVGLDDIEVGFPGQPTWSSGPRGDDKRGEARALAATCAGVRVWSLYVPNGRALNDPHYTYKLNWLAALRDTAETWLREDSSAQIALAGDWNIAPTDDDVWSIEFYRGCTHVSEPERKAFNAIVDAQFTDVVRPFAPGPGVYTYWDYTALRFPKGQGMRIDFILASPALAVRVVDARIVREERKGKAASDHAPVVVDLRRD
ncbi:exodeoxyribonuclease III [Mycobacterium xenopi]|nr:exodeoxyribonuclease III [Mycobacterium xenopi]MDA3640123.1 exodeoxyribonuclease III [Mycobacterium xenopi]MDA3658647.1 exodeoxyribonuclease III [Mycobacterium xenopi]MDA3660871.1 exodeoxyribonuclease III [Mycobacterium xenopi]ORX17155.1 exodeoxyribonuclease III [Mycobacterium xenopi]